MRSHGSHEFDTATGSSKGKGPDRVFAGETDHIAQLGCKKSIALVTLGHISHANIPFKGLVVYII
jgi:hypothetical protein